MPEHDIDARHGGPAPTVAVRPAAHVRPFTVDPGHVESRFAVTCTDATGFAVAPVSDATTLHVVIRVRAAAGQLVLVAQLPDAEDRGEAATRADVAAAAVVAHGRGDASPDGFVTLEFDVPAPADVPVRLVVAHVYMFEAAATADDSPPPPEEVDAFIAADMPPTVRAGAVETVTVRLSRRQLDDTAGHRNAQNPIRLDPALPVRVKLRRRNLVVAPGTRDVLELTCPPPGAVSTGLFRVIGVERGRAEAILAVDQVGGAPFATLHLEVTVTDVPVTGDEPPQTDAAVVERLDARLRDLPTLTVGEDIVAGESTLTFELRLPHGRRRTYLQSTLPDKAAYLDELYGCVEQLWDRHRHRSTATERHRAFESDLARYGLELGARLLPDALRGDLAAAWQMLTGLTIVTTETDIPWELVCIDVHGGRRRFLGETGMTRWFCGGTHPTALPLRRGHRRYLCPEYSSPKWQLQHLSDERALLGRTLDADEITPGSADDLGAVLGGRDVDLLHFGGHGDVAVRDGAPQPRLLLRGFSDRTPPDPSAVYSADRVRSDLPRPSPPDPESGSVPRHRPGPLVVLNACRAGRTIRTGTDAFAPSLLSGGAGAVLCCLWQVQDDTAAKFVRTFYSALTHSATVSAALTTARRAARDDGNASWLAYALYAHPFATVDLESP